MDRGYGKLSFFYSGIFNGSELLNLKPKEFESCRFNNFNDNIANPKNFIKFFNLHENDQSLGQHNKKNEISFEYIDDLNLNFFKFKNKEFINEKVESYENFSIIPPVMTKNDFSYSTQGIFFKTEFLIYEQVYSIIKTINF